LIFVKRERTGKRPFVIFKGTAWRTLETWADMNLSVIGLVSCQKSKSVAATVRDRVRSVSMRIEPVEGIAKVSQRYFSSASRAAFSSLPLLHDTEGMIDEDPANPGNCDSANTLLIGDATLRENPRAFSVWINSQIIRHAGQDQEQIFFLFHPQAVTSRNNNTFDNLWKS